MSKIEVVIQHWRRVENIPLVVSAYRSQSIRATVTLIDASEERQYRLPSQLDVDRRYALNRNLGPFNRFALAGCYDHEYTLFVDDDFLPGPKAVEYMLSCAERCPLGFGILGWIGRNLGVGGSYAPGPMEHRGDSFRQVDVPLRAFLIRTRNLHLPLALRNRLGLLDGKVEDDILSAASMSIIRGLRNYLVPNPAASEAFLISKELDDDHAWWRRPNHFRGRDELCRRLVLMGWQLSSGSNGEQTMPNLRDPKKA